MRQLSAVDAITPAWNHTRRLLVAPRNAGLALKIGAVAVFAQMGGCNSSFSGPSHHMQSVSPAVAATIFAAAFAIGLIALAIGLVLFYLGSRLQFVLFEVVLRSDTTVGPIWNRYGAATWRWMGLKILFFAVALVCIAPFLIPMVLHFIRSLPAGQDLSPHDLIPFITAMLGFVAIILCIAVVVGAAYVLLYDFGLPSMALESTTLGETVRRVVRLARAEPGQVFLYLVLRVLMGFAAIFVCEVSIAIGAVIALIPFGGAGFGLWAGFHNAGVTSHILMIGGWLLLGVTLLALVIMAAIILVGYVYTFLQAYALYFLGGRYPKVGEYLAPYLPPPTPYYAPAAYGHPPTP